MAVDTDREFTKLTIGIKKDVFNRRNGAFYRAIWYGGRSRPARALGWVQGKVMQKGPGAAGKGARNVVHMVATPLLTPIGAAAGGAIAGMIAKGVASVAAPAARKLSRWWNGLEQGLASEASTKFDEAYKAFKKEPIPVIDRNVGKLDDAIRESNRSIQALEQAVGKPAHLIDLEDLSQRAESAMRGIYEVGYYHAKTCALLEELAKATKVLSDELAKMDDTIFDRSTGVESTAKEILRQTLATAEAHEGAGPTVPTRGTPPRLPPKPGWIMPPQRPGPPPLPPKPMR